MKERVRMDEEISVEKRKVQRCERCNGFLMVRDVGIVCASCGGIHQIVKGRWVYTGGGK